MELKNNVIVALNSEDEKHLFIPKEATSINLEAEYHGFFRLLESIKVEEGNPMFYVKDNCLMDRDGVLYCAANGATGVPNDGSVRVIAAYAFNMVESVKGDVVIPEGVEKVCGAFAFGGSDIDSVYIPASVKYIGEGAFGHASNKNLQSIVVDKRNADYYTQDGCLIDRNTLTVVSTYGDTVVVPNGVKSIGQAAFLLGKFKKVVIPDSVEEIDDANFIFLTVPEVFVTKDSYAESYLKNSKVACSHVE